MSVATVLPDRETLTRQLSSLDGDAAGTLGSIFPDIAQRLAGNSINGPGVALALTLILRDQMAPLETTARNSLLRTALGLLPDVVRAIVTDPAVRDEALAEIAKAAGTA